MSGIIGHVTYAILAAKAARHRRLPVAPIVHRHFASYLAGSYLGSDVQTLPAAVCQDTGEEVGYCDSMPATSPLTGGPVVPWTLEESGTEYTPRQIYEMFYGRAHLVFGWSEAERGLAVAWEDLPKYFGAVLGDAIRLFGPGEREIAYLLGWAAHVVSDSLIKSAAPGITLHLLDGKYTPRNRPIQDLVCFHEIGRSELRLRWPDLLADLAETPVEPAQLHAMRVATPRGQLAAEFPEGWTPRQRPLLETVLRENRRYQQVRNRRLLAELELVQAPGGWQCSEELSRQTGGLSYAQMVASAKQADFRHALWQMAEAIADLFARVVQVQPLLQEFPSDDGPTWEQLTRNWRAGGMK
jgi:hypothetical protein